MKEFLELLGTWQRDKVTDFEGMVSSLCFDAYGCVQVILTPKVGADGNIPEGKWFDVKRLHDPLFRVHNARILDVPDFGALYAPESQSGPAEKPLPPQGPR